MALGRNALFGAAVTAALGVPFALSDKEETSPVSKAGEHGQIADDASVAAAGLSDGASPHAAVASLPAAVEGAVVNDLGEILRFDRTPAWITGRWPRVMNSRHAA